MNDASVTKTTNTPTVPFIDLAPQHEPIRLEIERAVKDVIESQQFILGATVRRFEENVAAYINCRAAIGVASGTDALLLALMALGIGAGDVVLVPSFTFFSSVSCITRVGATPAFVDVRARDALIAPDEVEKRISQCRPARNHHGLIDRRSGGIIRAILPVHLYGQCCDMGALSAIARSYDLAIIEDVAQAFGARNVEPNSTPRYAGQIGDLGCFSFFPTKNLGAFGDGGLVATDQGDLSERVRALRVHGESSKYRHDLSGINSRLDAIQAAVLNVKLGQLDHWCEQRINHATIYRDLFAATDLLENERVGLPPIRTDRGHVYNYFVIRAQRRDALREFLRQHRIQTEVYYPTPMHLQPCLKHLDYTAGDLPASERLASETLALPIYPFIPVAHQERVVENIESFYRHAR